MNQKSDSTRPAPAPPASKSLVRTNAGAHDIEARSQIAQVPIDEVQAIGVKVAPTYQLDDIQSVTLKSFRKVIGYDTFESILNKERNEKKNPADYYNVTVSMMIKRNPQNAATYDKYTNADGKTLGQIIDKGFPYDDGDSVLTERIADIKKMSVGTIVGKLNGENVTKEALVNLLKDKTTPVTQSLAQVSSKSKGSGAGFALLDNNVSVTALKNLVIDKPAPITTKLAQTQGSGAGFALLDNNVSVTALKNLVIDKPAPITTKLAQKSDADNLSSLLGENITRGALKNLMTDKPAPITMKLAQTQQKGSGAGFALLDNNVSVTALKNLVIDKPAPITTKLAQTSGSGAGFALLDNNVSVTALKNLVIDKPAPITTKLALIEKSDADNLSSLLGENITRGALKNLVTDKPAPITMKLAQTNGPAVTVQPESMLRENTMASARLGLQEVRVGPDEFNLNQRDKMNVQLDAQNPVWNPPFNNWSVNQPSGPHATGDAGHQDLELRDIIIDGVNGYDLV
jgi:hypothetical protein